MSGQSDIDARIEEFAKCIELLARRFRWRRRLFAWRPGRATLSRQERYVLEVLGERPVWRTGELATRLEIGASTLTSLVDRLEEKKMALRSRDRSDRRVVLVKLTQQGRRRFRQLRLRRFQRARELLNQLSKEDQEAFLSLLRKMAGGLSVPPARKKNSRRRRNLEREKNH
ncbi:MAG: MarR family winged helix-turn-helix transcriptional regulator [Kiritimatiellia bacterium]